MLTAWSRGLSALDTKVVRDVRQLWTQLLAIALVIACGVGVFLGMRATMRSLDSARAVYYASERFADVFAHLERAPESVAPQLAEIPGVRRLQTRVVADVTLDVPGLVEAATGRLVSLPDRGEAVVNGLRLLDGRLPGPRRGDEVVASKAFFEANGLELGERISAVINGRTEELRIVGIGLSPEFTYSVGPGQIFPDERRFGVLWMRRAALGPAFDMEGAFNDVVLNTDRDASTDAVIEHVDRVLQRYGGIGAIPRGEQTSAFFIENELAQLFAFGFVIPLAFLLVAALLLNVVLGRIIASQREQIAALKALGYHDAELGLHYAKLVGVVVVAGVVLGVTLAAIMGSAMIRLYAQYFQFPELPFKMRLGDLILASAISALAAGVGTFAAILRSVRLPPAEGMRPAAPAAYRPTLLERLGWASAVPASARMVLREVERRPARAALSVIGIALATSLIVGTNFPFDSMQRMINLQFGLQQREDVQVSLFAPRATAALRELEHLPGVMHAEAFRGVPVRLRAGHRKRNVSLLGIPRNATLHAVLDARTHPIEIPPEGVVLSSKLAEVLDVRTGDPLRVELLEGSRRTRETRVARIAETFVGLAAYMELDALCHLLGEAPSLSGAWLLVDDSRLEELHAAVKRTPIIAGVAARHTMLRSLREILDESLGTTVSISLGFSLVMALGVLYNAARITLAERARDLASLRVLGFRRGEVSRMLVGEISLLTVVGLPLGLVGGYLLAQLLVNSSGFDSEQFRFPLVISLATYLTAVLTIVAATGLACFAAWRRLDRIDIVQVLKTKD